MNVNNPCETTLICGCQFSHRCTTLLRRFGAASFCCTGNYGMPQFVTNTMRLCTKDALNASYDATVPAKPLYKTSSSAWTTTPTFDSQEQCSDSPYDVPWSLDDPSRADNPAAMFAVGSVPMWDGVTPVLTSTYPADGYAAQLYITNPGTAFQTWGEGCADGELLTCSVDADCVSLQPSRAKLQCYRGVCVMDMKQSPSCYSHQDCQATNQMCSGDGKCVDPILQVVLGSACACLFAERAGVPMTCVRVCVCAGGE